MEGVFGPMPQCPAEKPCLKWVQIYLLDCVCSTRDRVSLALGLMSVVSWGVAEVPQILTNFREKTTEGVSLLFLMTWVVGDAFNLMGCYLEPATLPTQFYMAILYTLTTIVLVLQTIYYDHVVGWWRTNRVEDGHQYSEVEKTDMESQKPLPIPESPHEGSEYAPTPASSQPTSITVPHHHHRHGSSPGSRDQLFIQSARSLASSYAQPMGSYNVPGSRGSTGEHNHNSYLLTQEDSEPPVLLGSRPRRGSSASLSTSALRTMASGVLIVGSLGLSLYTSPRASSGTIVGATFAGRDDRLADPFLQEEPSPLGEFFGWIMAGIYMGGRLPQIWLNIKRGTVEGLNPLMFVFALVGNVTYVGSILVRSLDWQQLKPNLAWLVDAGVCVILDIFILCQFVYYYTKVEEETSEEESGPYKPLN